MNFRSITAVVLLSVGLCAGAAVKEAIRIKVLDSETHSVVIDDSGVPKNCDQVNFDAYCHNSKTTQVTNTLLVQEDDQPPFRISCTIDTKWSHCIPLQRGQMFDAKREKRGLLVYYADDNGKARSQLYTLVSGIIPTQASAAPQPAPRAAASKSAAAATPAPVAVSVPSVTAHDDAAMTIKCNFTSTPPGAEITLDGKYVGSTPSEIAVAAGMHAVVLSLPGFAQWRRDLTVTPSSELTVNAVLEKQ